MNNDMLQSRGGRYAPLVVHWYTFTRGLAMEQQNNVSPATSRGPPTVEITYIDSDSTSGGSTYPCEDSLVVHWVRATVASCSRGIRMQTWSDRGCMQCRFFVRTVRAMAFVTVNFIDWNSCNSFNPVVLANPRSQIPCHAFHVDDFVRWTSSQASSLASLRAWRVASRNKLQWSFLKAKSMFCWSQKLNSNSNTLLLFET